LRENSSNIISFSNGFKDFIIPIVKDMELRKRAFANEFIYDESDRIVDFSQTHFQNNGRSWKLSAESI
jgi:D-3-phosphoglycerate dehydrogenase